MITGTWVFLSAARDAARVPELETTGLEHKETMLLPGKQQGPGSAGASRTPDSAAKSGSAFYRVGRPV
jgi:hypothetical protein